MPKENLKDKVEGNELDLSLSNLTSVPVKELVAIPKATHLDLSCNLLSELPENFRTLTHLVKIDLSKNLLSSLPEDFGDLRNLQHLDLLGNKLSMLPLSFFQLRKLKWLDLKDNPLEVELKQVAGDCLDEKQCKKCAADVVEYMRIMNNRLEKMRQREEEERRREEEARMAEIEREKQRKKEEKKREKELKRLEYERSRPPKSRYEDITESADRDTISDEDEVNVPADTRGPRAKRGSICSCSCLLKGTVLTMALLSLLFTGLMLHCGQNPSENECEAVHYKSDIVPLKQTYFDPLKQTYFDPLKQTYFDPFAAVVGEYCRVAYSYTTDKLEYVGNITGEYYYSAADFINKKWREFNSDSPKKEEDTQGQRADTQDTADKKDAEKEKSSAKEEEKKESSTKKEGKKEGSTKKEEKKGSTKKEEKKGSTKKEEKKKDPPKK